MKSLLAVVIVGLAILAKVCFAGVPTVALALQYADATHLIGANMLRLHTGELIMFDNNFQCTRWARVEVAKEKNKKIAYGCFPIPTVSEKDVSRVATDPVPVRDAMEDIAVAFEYGTTHQLVAVKTEGRADNDADCMKKGNDTLSSSKIPPGWVVIITCVPAPAFPPASSSL